MSDCEACESPVVEPRFNSPFVTFFDVHGMRVYSVETPGGVVHLIADEVFEHASEAVRSLRSVVNPVLAAMAQEVELEVSEPVEVKE